MGPGSFVNLHLVEPVERMWGRLYRLDPAGVVFRGIYVNQVEHFKYQFGAEEKSVYPQTFFFPMRRLLKLDLDEPMETVPSIISSIQEVTGLDVDQIIEPSPFPL